MRIQDEFLLALTIWRENRGGGYIGMRSVANVILNRVAKRGSNAYIECVRFEQFTSISVKSDPEIALWPPDLDSQWQVAQTIAATAQLGKLDDITGGATLYYAPKSIETAATFTLPDGSTIPFPQTWNAAAVTYLTTIAGQAFFKAV